MERRKDTKKKSIRLTQKLIDDVQAWADQHHVSFSAALESLANVGLEKPLEEALAPVILSLIRGTIHSEYDRLIRLVIYGIVESGYAARMASAAVRQQVKDLDTFNKIRNLARTDARKNLTRNKIGEVMRELIHDREASPDGDSKS